MLHNLKFSNYFDEVNKSKLPVVVEFYAPWCDHCARVTPIIEKLSEEYDGRVKFCLADTDEEIDEYITKLL